ncbi:unnamed protein product [Cladocopium goreaui]|uniref:GABA transporter 1 n=1 Tax=Cladocopium goreaui TaxID=2562237 RepID=A0A9P1GP75_9DINO|nr:unnamed protein product [Cladocopium goreaui]
MSKVQQLSAAAVQLADRCGGVLPANSTLRKELPVLLSDDQANELYKKGMQHLEIYGYLNSLSAAQAGVRGHGVLNRALWLLLPKHHHFMHMLEDARTSKINPSWYTLLCAESYIGQMGRLNVLAVTLGYLSTAVLAYLAFGPTLTGFLPTNLQDVHTGDGFILSLNVLLIVNTIALGAIYIQAGFNMVEDIIEGLTSRSFLFRFLSLRIPWVASATFIAVALPFFGDLAGLSGAIGFTPMTFVLPFLLWERSEYGARLTSSDIAMDAILGISFATMGVAAFAGALYLVIRDSSTYQFFS